MLELLLTLCIPRKDVKPPAKALLARFGTLRAVLEASPEELREVEGIGAVAPVALKIVREASTLYLQQVAEDSDMLNSTEKIETFWRARLAGLKSEVFEAAYLNKAYKLIKDSAERVEEGTVDYVNVYPRKILKEALRREAKYIIVAHNHPTGRAQPSQADHTLTQSLKQAAQPLGIELVDHLIIAGEAVFSFRREGLL